MCTVVEKLKADQETMVLVSDQQQQGMSKMRSIFVDCQSGYHSHESLIKTLTKVYNNVSGKAFFFMFAVFIA